MADETRTVIIDVEVEDRDFNKEIANVNDELEDNRKLIRELKKDYSENAEQIAKLEARNRELAKTKRQLVKESETEANSLNALRLQLANLTRERNNTNTSTEEGAKRFRELQVQIKATSEEIKGLEQESGDFRRNVGNYPQIADAIPNFKGLLAAINPVTIAVGALTAATAALTKAYLDTGRGARQLARAQSLLKIVKTDLGNTIADLIGDTGKGLTRLERVYIALNTAINGAEDSVNKLTQIRLREELRSIEVTRLETERLAKAQLDQAEQLRQTRDEERNSIEERRAANIQLGEVINEREREQLAFAERQLEIFQQLLALDEENLELQQAVAQAEFEIADIREENQGFRSEQLLNELALSREVNENQLALEEARIQGQIDATEEGTQERFKLEKRLIEITRDLQVQAAGENAQLRAIANQEALNAQKQLVTDFEAFQKDRRKKQAEDAEKQAEEAEELLERTLAAANELDVFRLESVGKLIEAELARRAILLENEELLQDERQLIIEQSDAKILQLKKDQADKELQIDETLKNQQLQNEQESLTAGIALFGAATVAGKSFALTQIGIDTSQAISALTKASEQNPLNGPTFGTAGIIQFAAGLLRIGTNIAKAKQVLEGGGSSGALAGFGGATSSSISSVPTANNFGLATVNATLLGQFGDPARQDAQNTQDVITALSSLPSPEVSVKEIDRVQNRVIVKETESNLLRV